LGWLDRPAARPSFGLVGGAKTGLDGRRAGNWLLAGGLFATRLDPPCRQAEQSEDFARYTYRDPPRNPSIQACLLAHAGLF
jgi:hypothetical protein